MQIVIDIPDLLYRQIKWQEEEIREQEYVCLEAILDGTPFPKCEPWLQLKETISEIKDNNRYDNETATELCKFLLKYMEVLEDADSD